MSKNTPSTLNSYANLNKKNVDFDGITFVNLPSNNNSEHSPCGGEFVCGNYCPSKSIANINIEETRIAPKLK